MSGARKILKDPGVQSHCESMFLGVSINGVTPIAGWFISWKTLMEIL
jgi:hypothetical protein